MSVLIKGMEIPQNCLECMFRISYWERALTPSGKIFTYGCILNGKEINILEKRCKDCPLVEIPIPHGRLIDADKLMQWIEHVYGDKDIIKFITDDIKRQPTIVEADLLKMVEVTE